MLDPNIVPADRMLAYQIGATLHAHYPGWCWYVEMPPNQNIAVVRNLDCDPKGRMGFVIYKTTLWGDPKLTSVMRAGGEFLERYRVLRKGYDPSLLDGRVMALEKPEV